MSRFQRHFRKHKPHAKFRGQRPKNVRPNRPHFRDFRKEAQQQAPKRQEGAAQPAKIEFPVAQARGPGHSRIMGQIEHDTRMLTKILEVPPDKTLLYLAFAREVYSDYENCKGDNLRIALDKTMAKWSERDVDQDIVKRIRNKVTDTWTALKAKRAPIHPPQPENEPEPAEEQPQTLGSQQPSLEPPPNR